MAGGAGRAFTFRFYYLTVEFGSPSRLNREKVRDIAFLNPIRV